MVLEPNLFWVNSKIEQPIKFIPVIVKYKTIRAREIFQIAVWEGSKFIFPNCKQPLKSENVVEWAGIPR